MIKKSPQKILAEMEYIQNVIDEKELEVSLLKNKLKQLEKELAITTRNEK